MPIKGTQAILTCLNPQPASLTPSSLCLRINCKIKLHISTWQSPWLVLSPASSHTHGLTELAELSHSNQALETPLPAWERSGGSAGCNTGRCEGLCAMTGLHRQPPLQLAGPGICCQRQKEALHRGGRQQHKPKGLHRGHFRPLSIISSGPCVTGPAHTPLPAPAPRILEMFV